MNKELSFALVFSLEFDLTRQSLIKKKKQRGWRKQKNLKCSTSSFLSGFSLLIWNFHSPYSWYFFFFFLIVCNTKGAGGSENNTILTAKESSNNYDKPS